MESMRPEYLNVEDWTVLEERIIHDFSDRPIEVVQVLIGTLHYDSVDFHQHYTSNETPIIRWISRNQYKYLLANAGKVIW